jgi:hypothetical protein
MGCGFAAIAADSDGFLNVFESTCMPSRIVVLC